MPPRHTTLACVLLLVALSGMAAGHSISDSENGVAPDLVGSSSVLAVTGGFAGAAGCLIGDRCLGFVFDVGGIDDGDHHGYADGTCTVTTAQASLTFMCGTDRNDDGLVSNAPVCDAKTTPEAFKDCSADGNGETAASDNMAFGDSRYGSISVCFRADLDGGWDDVAFFMGANEASPYDAQFAAVELGLAGQTGCTPSVAEGPPFVAAVSGCPPQSATHVCA